MENVRINILIVTYNQEKYIGRAIESVLIQREWGLNKIKIFDDCSKDRNWDVICSYQEKYPNIIEAIQNEKNIGIYPNFEKAVHNRGDADLYYVLAGDDALCNGWFKEIQNFIRLHNLSLEGKAVSFFSSYKIISPDKKEIVEENNPKKWKCDSYSLWIRNKLNLRSVISSRMVYDRYKDIILDEGISLAESMYDSQIHLNTDINYFIPFVGTINYSGIGVSTKTFSEKFKKDIVYAQKRYLSMCKSNRTDKFFIQSSIYKWCFLIDYKLHNYFLHVFYLLRSYNPKIGFTLDELKAEISLLKIYMKLWYKGSKQI